MDSVHKWENKSTIYPTLETKNKHFAQNKKQKRNKFTKKVDTKKAMEIGNKYSESTIGLLTKDKLDLDEIRVTFCEN